MDKKIKHINWLFLGMILFMILMQVVTALVPGLIGGMNSYFRIIFSQLLLLVPVLVYFLVTKRKPKHVMQLKRIGLVNVLLTIIFAYCMLPVLTVANLISTLIGSSGTEAVSDLLGQYSLFEGLIFVALLPALVEEFIFRGVFYGTYRRNGIMSAALLSGFIFGCMHLNVNQFSYAFIMGVLIVFAIEVTGSIIPAFIIHFTFNATSVVLTKMLDAFSSTSSYMEQSAAMAAEVEGTLVYLIGFAFYIPIAVLGGVIGYFVLRQMAKNSHRSEHFRLMFGHRTGKKSITVPYIIASVLCIGLMIIVEVFN